MKKNILIGITGGIACYKSAALVSLLVQEGHSVSVVMTRAARKFIGAVTLEALTGKAIPKSMFSADHPLGTHIELSADADLYCIAPATADILAKGAHGIADDLVSTLLLTCTCPTLFAPAMNNAMWEKSSVQRNIQTLIADGYHIIPPEEGWLSCRQRGVGRMASPEAIAQKIAEL